MNVFVRINKANKVKGKDLKNCVDNVPLIMQNLLLFSKLPLSKLRNELKATVLKRKPGVHPSKFQFTCFIIA